MASIEADVVVVGAGPAGSTLALNLAPFRRVLLLDKVTAPTSRPGESLPAAAMCLLRDMHLEDAFLAQGHIPSHLSYSYWGANKVTEKDALHNLDGHGWHLDRVRFDAWLTQVAVKRGAVLLTQTRLLGAHRGLHPQAPWQLNLERMGKSLRVQAHLVIDASGRNSVLARHVGSQRKTTGKLVCGWLSGYESALAAGVSELHAEADGWWYSAPLPDRQRLLAFYTDADLPAARAAHSVNGLLDRIGKVAQLQSLLIGQGFNANGGYGFCAAHGVTLNRHWGDGWLAIGDAALAFDPLSSQGLFNALYTGLAGAETANRHLQGDVRAMADYGSAIAHVQAAYVRHLNVWYQQEQRWPENAFWQRRHGAISQIQ